VRTGTRAAATLLAAVLLAGAAPLSAPTARKAVRARASLDVVSGRIVENPVVFVEGERITAVGPGLSVPPGYEILDLGDVTILPGLIDCHTHITTTYEFLLQGGPMQDAVTASARAGKTLDAGFTTVRDLWAKDFTDVALRDAIQRGDVAGPRMLVATLAIGSTGGHNEDVEGLSPTIRVGGGSGIADGVDGVRKLVRYEIKYGADVIKIMATEGGGEGRNLANETQFTLDEMKAIVDEAHRYGMKVAAHAHGTDGIKTAIRAGVDSVEHGTLLDDEGVRLLKERGTFLVPTGAIWEMEAESEKADDPAWRKEREDAFRRGSREGFAKAVAAGVKIAMGSDASVLPQGENAKEIVWMAAHGMTPLEAIRAATVNAAELLGWSDRVGSIAPGKFADIIAVRGNPLQDIATLERVAWVMQGGVVRKDALGIAKVQALLAARKRGDEAAARALMAPDARIWFDERKGPGEPWGLVSRWSGWDSYFHSTSEYSDWREGRDSVTAFGVERNDFYRLIERPPQKFRATWWLDSSGKISGFLYEPRGAVFPGGDRLAEFKAWARRENPAELEYLMPGDRFDPTGDRPQRFHAILVEWRKAAGLMPVEMTPAESPKAPESKLTEIEWTLAALGGEAIPGQTGGRPITLSFSPDGRVSGSGGCNRVSGSYTRQGDALKFGPLATTRMACPAMDLERRFLGALAATARWKIVSGALELSDASAKLLARFR
jgi:imidazolonepropionase-like amidohydrolase/heat shock protein HslJ